MIRGKKWDEAIQKIDVRLSVNPQDGSLLRRKFDVLAVGKKEVEAASAIGTELCAKHMRSASELNNFAWALLTEKKYGEGFAELARECAVRSNELSNYGDWRLLDTLALANFESGDVVKAIELQKLAIENFDGSGLGDMKKSLARFEAKAQAEQLAHAPE